MNWFKEALVHKEMLYVEAFNKDVKQLIKKLERLGWRVDRSSTHPKAYCPCGEHMWSLPSTPRGGRWLKNLIGDLKRLCPQSGL